MTVSFDVIETAPMTLTRPNRLADMYTLSPFVWREDDGYHLLLRAVPRRDEPRLKIAEIWHGMSAYGLHFKMDEAPVIFPGPELTDLDGCEDPTVLATDGQLRVWHIGWNQQQDTGRLLLARGPDMGRLVKAGVVIESHPPFANPKEASLAQGEAGWQLFFEYAEDGASLIGQATAGDLDDPWTDVVPAALTHRSDSWDAWHLSPGPILDLDADRFVMFYNGATQNAEWRIGWALFDRTLSRVRERCEVPLIKPASRHGAASNIAFAASTVDLDGEMWLYFSQSDQYLRRAVVKF